MEDSDVSLPSDQPLPHQSPTRIQPPPNYFREGFQKSPAAPLGPAEITELEQRLNIAGERHFILGMPARAGPNQGDSWFYVMDDARRQLVTFVKDKRDEEKYRRQVGSKPLYRIKTRQGPLNLYRWAFSLATTHRFGQDPVDIALTCLARQVGTRLVYMPTLWDCLQFFDHKDRVFYYVPVEPTLNINDPTTTKDKASIRQAYLPSGERLQRVDLDPVNHVVTVFSKEEVAVAQMSHLTPDPNAPIREIREVRMLQTYSPLLAVTQLLMYTLYGVLLNASKKEMALLQGTQAGAP